MGAVIEAGSVGVVAGLCSEPQLSADGAGRATQDLGHGAIAAFCWTRLASFMRSHGWSCSYRLAEVIYIFGPDLVPCVALQTQIRLVQLSG